MIANGTELQNRKRRAGSSALGGHLRPLAAPLAALGLLLVLLVGSRPPAIVAADDACQETPCELFAGQTETFGTISTKGGQSVYYFNAVAGTALHAALVDLDADLDLHLYDPTDFDLQRSWNDGLEPEEIQLQLPEDGRYVLSVFSDPLYGDPQASYHLLVTITPPQPGEPVVVVVPTLNPVEDPGKQEQPPVPASPTPQQPPAQASPTQSPVSTTPTLAACEFFTDADAESLYEEPQFRGIVGGGNRATGVLGPYDWPTLGRTAEDTCFFIVPTGAYMSASYFRNPKQDMYAQPVFPMLGEVNGVHDAQTTAYVSPCGFPALIRRGDLLVVYGLREFYEDDGYSPTPTSTLGCAGFRARVETVLSHAKRRLIALGY